MRVIENISYIGTVDKDRILNLYMPDGASTATFVYFHGGGLEHGSHEFDLLGKYLVEKGVALISAQYRMYPDAKYPDFIEDSASAVKWALDNANEYGYSNKIFVGGSSAGGYLSMMLCFDDRWLGAEGLSPMDVAGYIHDAGQPTAHFNVLKEAGVDSRRVIVDERAPIYYIGLAERYAPMLFIVSDNDMQNRYEQTMLTLSTLKHFEYDMSKVVLKEMHGRHCQYVGEVDEDGESKFGKIVYDFMNKF